MGRIKKCEKCAEKQWEDPYYGQHQIYVIEEVIEWYENPNF
jgi:hypothetical protein